MKVVKSGLSLDSSTKSLDENHDESCSESVDGKETRGV